MQIPVYLIDAFTSRPFAGNPAAICPLQSWLPDATLQSIANEHNLSETAYYVPNAKGAGHFDLRWFTPEVEVDLCGHATLASAHVIRAIRREYSGAEISFHTKSGVLTVTTEKAQEAERYVMDFPARPPLALAPGDGVSQLTAALGAIPQTVLAARDYFCVFESEAQVLALKPDMTRLAAIDKFAVIVTAPGSDCDFVSRFFAPAKGVPEDAVTGSAHCSLIPYWAARLNKQAMFARQRSKRGGEIWCRQDGDRVGIAGHAVKFSEGVIELSEGAGG